MDPHLRALGLSLLRGLVPYPDLARRRRVRAGARALVTCVRWPADDAVTGADVAQLALLRVLSLQHKIRRAALSQQREAAVLLARSSLEACILGIYCLHHQDAVERLRAANIKATIDVLGYLADDGFVPTEVIDRSLRAFGEPGERPSVWKMAKKIETVPGGAGAISLYRRFYVPTSTFFVHANAASLLRHVKADDSLTGRPTFPWTVRSAVRVGDACVGILAAAVARVAEVPVGEFDDYAEEHIKRAFTPLAVMAGKGLGRTMKPVQLWTLARQMLALRRYYASGQVATDPIDVREAHVRAVFDTYTAIVFEPGNIDPSVPQDAFVPLIDYFVSKILADIATPPAGPRLGQDPHGTAASA